MVERKKRTIGVFVEVGDALTFPADVLALKYAQTHYGVEEAVFTRLSQAGQDVSTLLPKVDEYKIVDTHNQISSRAVLFVGVKQLGQFKYRDIRESSYRVLASLAKAAPETKHVCLTLHGPGYWLDEAESFNAEIAGFLDAIDKRVFPEELEHITIIESNPTQATRFRQLLSQLIPSNLLILDDKSNLKSLGEIPSRRLHLAGYPSASKRKIFVAMPFDDDDMLDTFHFGILGPVNTLDYFCERSDLSTFTGDVLEWIKKRIATAHLVIAELSGANPNVYLEVGYAWGCGRKTVLLAKKGEELKFDTKGQRCLFYDNIKHLEEILRDYLEKLDQQSIEDSMIDTMDVEEVISETDSMDFPKYVSKMVYEVSSGDDTKRTKAYELMQLALRCAFLVDLYAEKDNSMYLEGAEGQLAEIYSRIPEEAKIDLISIVSEARKYFDYEKELQRRIQENKIFAREDRRRYLYGKSGDALVYGRLLEAVTPAWNLTDELRIQMILYDIGKDIKDYEDDIKGGFPNILYLYFSGRLERMKIPKNLRDALRLANELGISRRILQQAAELKEEALKSKYLYRSPTLRKTIIDHYERIEQLLGV